LDSYFYFSFIKSKLRYEIIIFKDFVPNMQIEPFLYLTYYNNHTYTKEQIDLFINPRYFVVCQNKTILLYKAIKKIYIDDIVDYLYQMYGFENINIIDNYNLQDKKLPNKFYNKNLYQIKQNNQFVFFNIFITLTFFGFAWYSYNLYLNHNIKEYNNLSKRNKVYNNFIDLVFEIFNITKLYHIQLGQIKVTNNKVYITMYHNNKTNLLNFANSYNKNMQIKYIKYNQHTNQFKMEVVIYV
jgi:hypothetical protein